MLWTRWALFVCNMTSCELYFVWERKDRVTNLELPPKAECPLSPQGPKIHTNRAVCLFGNGACGCLYWRFLCYPSGFFCSTVAWDSLLKVLWVFPSPAQFGQHLKRGPKSESHPWRKCVIRRVCVLCLLYDHMSVQCRLYVLECLCASAAAAVLSWAFAVWLHGDVWRMFGHASSPRSITEIYLVTTRPTSVSAWALFFFFCYEHISCFSLISIKNLSCIILLPPFSDFTSLTDPPAFDLQLFVWESWEDDIKKARGYICMVMT